MKNISGFTMIELVMVIVIISIVATYVAVDLGSTPDSVRFEQTRAKLEAIRVAILGDDTLNAEGAREHFGYFGDMGRIPTDLTDLTTIGAQPAWAFNATLGFGTGWRGPYISEGVTGSPLAITKDEWGTALVYNTSEPTPRITSKGADKADGGVGYAKDIIVELPQNLRLSTVKGSVTDIEAPISGKTVQIDFATNGSVMSSTTTSGASGVFTFANIPLGIRAIRVVSPPLGPKTVVIDRANQVLSETILNYGVGSKGLTVTSSALSGTASKGFSNRSVIVYIVNSYPEDRQVKSITVNWYGADSYVGGAKLLSYSLNGVTEGGFSAALKGTKLLPSSRQVIRRGPSAQVSVNPLELNFDSAMKGVSFAVTFEWVSSDKTDTITFTPDSPTWGSSGELDTGFGTSGMAQQALGISASSMDNAVMLQTDGKLAMFGTATGGVDFIMARWRFDGTLDTNFGTGGVGYSKSDFAGGNDLGTDMVMDTSGRFVGVGLQSNSFVIARYTTSGGLDTSFMGGTGYSIVGGAGTAYGWPNVALQTDGKIIATRNLDGKAIVYRYYSNGTLDTSFATNGTFNHDGPSYVYPTQVVIDTGGNILLSASMNTTAGTTQARIAAMRITTGGTLDSTFGTSGILMWNATAGSNNADTVALQTDGKVLLGGQGPGGVNNMILFRFGTNGVLDTTFASLGIATIPAAANRRITRIKVLSQGRIVVSSPDNAGTVARFLSNGALDTAFGTAGLAFTGRGAFDFVQKPTGQLCFAGIGNAGGDFNINCIWP